MEPEAYIGGYRQLSVHRVGFYPIHLDKSPAVHGKLNRVATVDPIKIKFWADHCHHRSFAARLLTGCRIVVIDTEDPFKHPDRPGPDGEMILGSLLEDTDTILPPCPMVRTASGGFHRYLLVPRGFRIRPTRCTLARYRCSRYRIERHLARQSNRGRRLPRGAVV